MADMITKEFVGERIVVLGPGQEPPDSGWAISHDHAVFENGKQVGTWEYFQLGSTANSRKPRNYARIDYEPLSEDA